jgi:Peptidase S46
MKPMSPPRLPLPLLMTCLAASPALADEGMWLPNQTAGLAAQLEQAGLKLTAAELGNLQRAPLNAIVSLGGCSAAFVSPQGLVATNHHCVYGSIQYNSRPEQDYLTNGFLAATLSDELPAAPGSRIFVIEDLRDVTAAMGRGLKASLPGLERYKQREANRKQLIAECEKQPNRRCDVRPYFGGSAWYLQQQLEIQDVRLVYAPASGIGNFGGETDNWMWPRHTGDFGFYRAYVAPDGASAPFSKENRPYEPKAWLKVAAQGVADGDFVMVAGFPGVTQRLTTAAEAKFNFDTYLPQYQRSLSDYSDRILAATQGNAATTIKYASIVRGADNYKKKTLGQLAGADAIGLNARKQAEETAYRQWIAADPKREAGYGAAARTLDAVVTAKKQAALDGLKIGVLDRAQLLSAARTLYRWAKESEKPDAAREAGYQARDRRLVEDRLRVIERRFDAGVDRILFEDALSIYRTLPADKRDARFEAKLAQISLDKLYADTKLADTAVRLGWLDRPAAQIEASDDPFLQLAVALYQQDMAREEKTKARAGDEDAAKSVYIAGMRQWATAQGRTLYPDANGSLRYSYGKVTGKAKDGQIWTAFTSAEGLLAKHTGKGEFDAPDRMIQRLEQKDYGRYAAAALGTLPVNFLSTLDITNGNSGSATLNARGEFVGLAFDGTLEGVVSDWSYVPAINRTIHVDSRFMLWTMDKIDGAGRLLQEMGVAGGGPEVSAR